VQIKTTPRVEQKLIRKPLKALNVMLAQQTDAVCSTKCGVTGYVCIRVIVRIPNP